MEQGLNRRIDDLRSTTLTLFSVLLGMMAAFVGFVLWDRRSMLKPIQRQMQPAWRQTGGPWLRSKSWRKEMPKWPRY